MHTIATPPPLSPSVIHRTLSRSGGCVNKRRNLLETHACQWR